MNELASGKMVRRRPEANETSHYKNPATPPIRPQLGLDLPSEIGGHILFGVVPGTTNTFVQTEGAGFQNSWQHIVKHGLGAFWNMAPGIGGWQTGLIGYSKASEKTDSHLEQENTKGNINSHMNMQRKAEILEIMDKAKIIDLNIITQFDQKTKLSAMIGSRDLTKDSEYDKLLALANEAKIIAKRHAAANQTMERLNQQARIIGTTKATAILQERDFPSFYDSLEVLRNKQLFIKLNVEMISLKNDLQKLAR